MKIAIVHNLPPGGQKRALSEQVKRLSKRHKLDLFTLSSTDESFCSLLPYIQKHKTAFYNPPPHFPRSVISIYKDLPKSYRKLSEMINAGNYDLVYVNPCYLTQAPYVLRYLKIPSIYYCPEPKREFYEKVSHVSNKLSYSLTLPFRLPIKTIDRTNARHATKILTNSYYSKEKIDQIYGVVSLVNYLGVETTAFKPAKMKKENLVLTVGEFSLHKGHDFIIKSLAKITKTDRPGLVIIGHEGIEKKYLRRLAKQREVKVDFLENISDTDLIGWYNRARAFVYAGIREPFGMCLLEAASCGLPITAVKEGAVLEIIDSAKIGLLSERDEVKFAHIVQKVLAHSLTDKDKEEIHEYIRKKWNWEKSVAELEKHFLSVIR